MKQLALRIFYACNPCMNTRMRILAPIGDALAALWDGFTAFTDCACCLGTRLALVIALAFFAGTLV